MVLNVGRVCVKIAGRAAGKKCVIVKELDNTYVLVDGQTRRRKVNKFHLEPLEMVLSMDEDADNAAVVAALADAGIEASEKKSDKKGKETVRPKRQKAVKAKAPATDKKSKKQPAEKKAKPAKTEKAKKETTEKSEGDEQ